MTEFPECFYPCPPWGIRGLCEGFSVLLFWSSLLFDIQNYFFLKKSLFGPSPFLRCECKAISFACMVTYTLLLSICYWFYWTSLMAIRWRAYSATLTTFFLLFFREEGIQIPLKAGHHHSPAKRHLNGVLLANRWRPNIECLLGSFENFENFRGSGQVLLRNPIFLWFFRGDPAPCPPPPASGSAHSPHQLKYFFRVGPTLIKTLWICAWGEFQKVRLKNLQSKQSCMTSIFAFLNWTSENAFFYEFDRKEMSGLAINDTIATIGHIWMS